MQTDAFLPQNLRDDFLIRLLFNTADGFEYAGIRKAYLDFNRTLKINDRDLHPSNKIKCEDFLKSQLLVLISKELESQKDFDSLHQELCDSLIGTWSILTYGQAQKWINMTLKYWLVLGEHRIKNIEKNARFFHIPIDSYVQKGWFQEKKPKAWSKINNYDDYMEYQKKHRASADPKSHPLLEEFKFFNNYRP